jgi:hypothetical protein
MTTPEDQAYLLRLAQLSVMGNPTEYDAYGVVTETFFVHKNPRDRYTIFPQLYLPWSPQDVSDARGTPPDFGLGCYFHIPPHVRLQGGAEVKRATSFMIDLPPCGAVGKDESVMETLHACSFQARDQDKAAVKGGHLPNKQLLWLMFILPSSNLVHSCRTSS